MRYLATIFLTGFFLFPAISFSATLSAIGRLADAGAPQLALAALEQSPPSRQQHPGQWLSWQSLHISLLARLNQSQAVLDQVKTLPANAPAALLRPADWAAARAALALQQGPAARRYLARLLWQTGISNDARYREARRLVIQSYVDDGELGDAYRAMLRFQQDFSLDSATTAAFVQALSDGGQAADALTWLARLDDASPLALSVKLKTGMISPSQAIAAARAALGRTLPAVASRRRKPRKSTSRPKLPLQNIVGYWRVIRAAATIEKNTALRTRADEQLLNAGAAHATAKRLWRDYLAQAKIAPAASAQNGAALLAGATQSVAAQPLAARTVFAALAADAKEKTVRQQAITALVDALASAKLGGAALRLFSDPAYFPQPAVISPAVRYRLGGIAQARGDAAAAAHYWKGLDAPPAGEAAAPWRLKRAEVFMAAGDYAAVAATAASAPTSGAAETGQWLVLARRLAAAGQNSAAARVLQRLTAAGGPAQRREALTALGAVAAVLGDHRRAAAAYLQAAILAPPSGNSASQSRRRAAENLVQAGFITDAKAQYARLLASTRNIADRRALRQRIDDLTP
ncbi:MAG TPA: hypothetical protein DEP05_06610 [Betaproteobacteria bacterium]|nr:hypothetical protein [Betaproteobacteria bacterium]